MGKRLYVGNLPYDADEQGLRAAFSKDGRTVERVHIVLDRETQRPRGFAFVEMATDEQAKAAIAAMDGAVYGTRQLRVTEAEERRPGGGPGGPGGPRPMGGGAPRSAGPGGPGGGGGGGGGYPPRSDDGPRPRNFGPDARPKREREREMEQRRASQPKRRADDNNDPFSGRRGDRRFDDDDEE
jgi:RNA recognition motif-containing protein